MESILSRRGSNSYDDFAYNTRGMHGLPGNSWGAGMYGAFYSPRNTHRPNTYWQQRRDEHRDFVNLQKTMDRTNDFLSQIKDSLATNLKSITDRVGIQRREDALRGKGTLAPEDRQTVLDVINDNKTYKTGTQALTHAFENSLKSILSNFTARGLTDMVLGRPKEGGWRARGREYQDALQQYTKDRMLVQGDKLKETYGGTGGAHAQIAKDFAQQQFLSAKIKGVEQEVNRRRSVGMVDDDINRDGLLDKLNELLDKYARVDPTNTGRHLQRDLAPTKPGEVPMKDRFRANTAAHKGFVDFEKKDGVWKYKDQPKVVPSAAKADSEEVEMEAARQHQEDQEEQQKQTSLLEKIAESLAINKKDKVEGFSDGKPAFQWSDLLKPLTFLGELASSLLKIGTGLVASLGGLGPIMASLGAVLAPLAAAAALLGLAKTQKEKIEANPDAPEFKDNAYAMKLRGEAVSVTQATKINQQKALKQLQPGTAAEYLKNGQQDENGLIDGYTIDQLQAMAAGKKPSSMPTVPMELKGKAEAAKLKLPPPSNSGEALVVARKNNEDAKAEAAKSAANVTVVAPTTNTTNVSNGGSNAKPMGPVRNQESTISEFVKKRYVE